MSTPKPGLRPARPPQGSSTVAEPHLPEGSDLGFTYRHKKNGDLEILHRGRLASTLRGADAGDFLAELQAGSDDDAQQLMARVTGNYKRGNERLASQHPRNRR